MSVRKEHGLHALIHKTYSKGKYILSVRHKVTLLIGPERPRFNLILTSSIKTITYGGYVCGYTCEMMILENRKDRGSAEETREKDKNKEQVIHLRRERDHDCPRVRQSSNSPRSLCWFVFVVYRLCSTTFNLYLVSTFSYDGGRFQLISKARL